MSVADSIVNKLQTAFPDAAIDLKDESHLHKGHAGAPEGGESHFRLRIVSEIFSGLSRVERQRRVNAALKDELAGPVHALAMATLTPEETSTE